MNFNKTNTDKFAPVGDDFNGNFRRLNLAPWKELGVERSLPARAQTPDAPEMALHDLSAQELMALIQRKAKAIQQFNLRCGYYLENIGNR